VPDVAGALGPEPGTGWKACATNHQLSLANPVGWKAGRGTAPPCPTRVVRSAPCDLPPQGLRSQGAGPNGQARGPAPTTRRGGIPQPCRGRSPCPPPAAHRRTTARSCRGDAVRRPKHRLESLCHQPPAVRRGLESLRLCGKPLVGLKIDRGAWALARFCAPWVSDAGEKEKNALPRERDAFALRPLGARRRGRVSAKAFFSFSPGNCLQCKKRAKAHALRSALSSGFLIDVPPTLGVALTLAGSEDIWPKQGQRPLAHFTPSTCCPGPGGVIRAAG